MSEPYTSKSRDLRDILMEEMWSRMCDGENMYIYPGAGVEGVARSYQSLFCYEQHEGVE